MPRLCQAALFALLLAVTGCGSTHSTAPQTVTVKGTVTLDTKPVQTGEIYFAKAGASSPALEIKDGTFVGDVPLGHHKVEVFVYVEGPKTPGKYGGQGTKTNIAPTKYSGPNTTLSATVEAGKPNEFKFDLTSK
jgi:hypothetical protein